MRKPKGKLVALLAGAVAVPLLTLAVLFWKDLYWARVRVPRGRKNGEEYERSGCAIAFSSNWEKSFIEVADALVSIGVRGAVTPLALFLSRSPIGSVILYE